MSFDRFGEDINKYYQRFGKLGGGILLLIASLLFLTLKYFTSIIVFLGAFSLLIWGGVSLYRRKTIKGVIAAVIAIIIFVFHYQFKTAISELSHVFFFLTLAGGLFFTVWGFISSRGPLH